MDIAAAFREHNAPGYFKRIDAEYPLDIYFGIDETKYFIQDGYLGFCLHLILFMSIVISGKCLVFRKYITELRMYKSVCLHYLNLFVSDTVKGNKIRQFVEVIGISRFD